MYEISDFDVFKVLQETVIVQVFFHYDELQEIFKIKIVFKTYFDSKFREVTMKLPARL